MIVLAVSTSSPVASAALMKNGVLLSMLQSEGAQTHSETLMPLIEALLESHGLTAAQLDGFAVDVGPGSFTGVRIGVCAVNAMAAARGKSVAGVCSLEALYENVRAFPSVCTLIDAKNEKAYAAHYLSGNEAIAPSAVEIATLLPLLPRGTAYVGDGALAYAQSIRARDETAVILESASTLLADGVAYAGHRMHLCGKTALEALPSYLRPSQAERLRAAGNEQN